MIRNMKKTINEDGYFGVNGLQILFYGWTNYNDLKYADFSDEIESLNAKNTSLKAGQLKVYMSEAEFVLKIRCFMKGIKFSGNYHQNGQFGTPLFRVIDSHSGYDKVLKWTCTFRYWGEIMKDAGYGVTYIDWAWDDYEKPVYPNEIEGENCVIEE